ncbi:MAG TPA: molecular chaperone DnaJ, partial [Novosphingobium sp.]|nr:molecular chaperone DnaJ [Novosphingobium sp.]
MKHDRFHGRHDTRGRPCDWPGCDAQGEFRAPGPRGPSFDGPGDYRWFCLDHVRAFNAGYDYFEGMSADEIFRAQSPLHGWERESRAFSPMAGIDAAPRWADFTDPLEAISARARARRPAERADGRAVTAEERRALDVLGLSLDADRRALRQR